MSAAAWAEVVRHVVKHVNGDFAAGAPVNFVSWHIYHVGSPATLARAQRQMRALVDEEGVATAEVLLTEWNLHAGQGCEAVGCRPSITGAYNAAHLVGAVTHLQDTDLPLAFRYRTDGTEMFGLSGDGVTESQWSRSGLTFRLLVRLYDTPLRLAAQGGDGAGGDGVGWPGRGGWDGARADRQRGLGVGRLSPAPRRGTGALHLYTVHEIADRPAATSVRGAHWPMAAVVGR